MEAETATVTVVYHYEDGLWWSESPDLPEFSGGGDTFEEARQLTQEGLAFALEKPVVVLDERFDEAAIAARRAATRFTAAGQIIASVGATATWDASSAQVPIDTANRNVASSRP